MRISGTRVAMGQVNKDSGSPRKIACLRTDRLGETILTLPAMAAIKAALPQATLTAVVRPELEEFVRGSGIIESVIAYSPAQPRGWFRRAAALAKELKARKIDLGVVFNPMQELHWALWLAGIPVRAGYDRKWGRLLTRAIPDRKALGGRHEVEYNFDLVRALGLPVGGASSLRFSFEAVEPAMSLRLARCGIQAPQPFAVIHPWTSNPSKRWPLERYRRLMEALSAELKLPMVVIGGPEESRQEAEMLLEGVKGFNWVGELTVAESAVLLMNAKLLVSNDSGPVHLSAAVGTPVVALFGASHPGTGPSRWGPWGNGHTVISKASMIEITVDEVFDAAAAYVR